MPRHPLPANLNLRALRLSDAEGVTALANLPLYRRGTLRLPYQRVEETRAFLEKPEFRRTDLVAELDGNIIGRATLTPFAGGRAHVGGIGMGVHDDWHGHGIGAALLMALIDLSDKWLGLRRLELDVFTDNGAAIGLYQKFGFEIEGTKRADALRDGVLVNSHMMARIVAAVPAQALD